MTRDVEFVLFRIKFIKKHQMDIIEKIEPIDEGSLLTAILNRKESKTLKHNVVWHVGNLRIEDNKGYFAFGKKGKAKGSAIDEKTGDFIETEYLNTPYTHVLYISSKNLIAIAKKSKLDDIEKIAGKLEEYLFKMQEIQERFQDIDIDVIRDPNDIFHYIDEAKSIQSLGFEIKRPNPNNYKVKIHTEMQNFLNELEAEKSESTLTGENLDKETTKNTIKSISREGSPCEIKFKNKNGKSKTKSTNKSYLSTIFDKNKPFEIEKVENMLVEVEKKYSEVE